ncbi:hypothetical protein LCGC14_1935500 [marine sediment metagenome]|uniref:Uncharacterized protein n=1 Tax=marine sediment metagenome TaxID=412755 RepID=A0A0F9IJE7_9ZZZZ
MTLTIQQAAANIADRLEDRNEIREVSDHGLLIIATPDNICTRKEMTAIKSSARRWAQELGYAARVSQPRSKHGENTPIYIRLVDKAIKRTKAGDEMRARNQAVTDRRTIGGDRANEVARDMAEAAEAVDDMVEQLRRSGRGSSL